MEQQQSPILSRVNQPHQFSYENGITLTHVEPGRAEGILNVNENSFNPLGLVHGGALTTLADTVGGTCACARGRSASSSAAARRAAISERTHRSSSTVTAAAR